MFIGPALAGPVHEYTVTVDQSLRELSVDARFDSPVHDIAARADEAGAYLLDVRDCAGDAPLGHRGRRLRLPDNGIACIRYRVDLASAAAGERRNRNLAADNIVVAPAVWLWRPPIDGSAEIVVRFQMPDGVRLSVPWPAVEHERDSFRLVPSPRSARAVTAFGDFVADKSRVPGADLRIAVLKPHRHIDAPAMIDWVRAAATNVSLAYGRFPNPSPQVVVIPVGGGRGSSPVPFGRVVRDGGEAIELFINERRPIDEFYDDWTATHEFSHLMLPYLRSSHRWISEGFAQYYQNLLLARAGQYTETRAWQKLYEGFERGRVSRPELSPNEAAERGVGRATMKIYWSGAVVALMADVELRRSTLGEVSLDSLLHRLQVCCLPSTRSWSGIELFEKLDGFVEEPVFMPLYEQHADSDGFPDIRPLFDELGIGIEHGRVHLEADAPHADIRKAITGLY